MVLVFRISVSIKVVLVGLLLCARLGLINLLLAAADETVVVDLVDDLLVESAWSSEALGLELLPLLVLGLFLFILCLFLLLFQLFLELMCAHEVSVVVLSFRFAEVLSGDLLLRFIGAIRLQSPHDDDLFLLRGLVQLLFVHLVVEQSLLLYVYVGELSGGDVVKWVSAVLVRLLTECGVARVLGIRAAGVLAVALRSRVHLQFVRFVNELTVEVFVVSIVFIILVRMTFE